MQKRILRQIGMVSWGFPGWLSVCWLRAIRGSVPVLWFDHKHLLQFADPLLQGLQFGAGLGEHALLGVEFLAADQIEFAQAFLDGRVQMHLDLVADESQCRRQAVLQEMEQAVSGKSSTCMPGVAEARCAHFFGARVDCWSRAFGAL